MSKTNIFDYRFYYKRYLPHIQPEDALLFVTYCLDFKYPEHFYQRLRRRKYFFEKSIKNLPEKEKQMKSYEFNNKQFYFFDNFVIKHKKSPSWLSDSMIAEIVKNSLFFRHEKEYRLICYCIMPNHVHILIKPLLEKKGKPYSITRIMKNHKSFTAVEANKILKRSGRFWLSGFYDHCVRNQREFFNIIRYILNNPVKAGLVKKYWDWKYLWVDKEVLQL